jgi:hydroxymethylpyrimidine/phosphomethylpyrimidine kinase
VKKLNPSIGQRKNSRAEMPAALTIAGSDSGGGAGIQADLKTFAALDVHGTSAITCITSQNPDGVRSIQPIRPEIVRDQIDAVFEAFKPAAVKTGMLYSEAIIERVVDALSGRQITLIVDPVMVATSGAILLKPRALKFLKEKLFPRASLVTPNLPEAEMLLDRLIRSEEELRRATRDFHARFGCPALLKGGHLGAGRTSVDFFFDGKTEWMLESPTVQGVSTHGTGCALSSAITAWSARGHSLDEAVVAGKEFISNAIASSRKVAGYHVLNSFWAA